MPNPRGGIAINTHGFSGCLPGTGQCQCQHHGKRSLDLHPFHPPPTHSGGRSRRRHRRQSVREISLASGVWPRHARGDLPMVSFSAIMPTSCRSATTWPRCRYRPFGHRRADRLCVSIRKEPIDHISPMCHADRVGMRFLSLNTSLQLESFSL